MWSEFEHSEADYERVECLFEVFIFFIYERDLPSISNLWNDDDGGSEWNSETCRESAYFMHLISCNYTYVCTRRTASLSGISFIM